MALLKTLNDTATVPEQTLSPLANYYSGGEGRVRAAEADLQAAAKVDKITNEFADKEAIRAGTNEGLKAGLTPGFKPLRGTSLYQQAYDKAGISAFMSQVENDASANAQRIYLANRGDPAKLKQAFDDWSSGYKANLFDEAQPGFEDVWNRRTLSYSLMANEEQEKTLADNTVANNAEALNTTFNDVSQMARSVQDEKTFGALVLKERQGFLNKMLEHAPREGGTFEGQTIPADPTRLPAYTWEKIQENMQKFDQNVAVERVMGKFDRSQDKEGFRKTWLDAVDKEKRGIYSPEMIDHIDTKMKADINEARAEQSRLKTVANEAINQVDDRMTQGYEIPAPELQAVSMAVDASKDPMVQQKFESLKLLSDQARLMRSMNPQQLSDTINTTLLPATQKDGASEFEVKRLDLATKMLDKMQTELKQDPISWAARAQNLPVQPLNISVANGQMQMDNEAMHARMSQAAAVSQFYQTPFRPFTQQEATAITSMLPTIPAQQQLGLAMSIGETAGRNSPAAFKQLGEKDAIFAWVGGMAAQDRSMQGVALETLQGRNLIMQNPERKPAEADTKPSFQDVMGNALAGMPETEKAIYESAVALYAQRAARAGQGAFDKDIFEKSLRDVMGGSDNMDPIYDGHYTAHQSRIILPSGVTADYFDDFVNRLNDRNIVAFSATGKAPTYSTGEKVSAENFRKGLKLEQFGQDSWLARNDQGYYMGGPPESGGVFVLRYDAAKHKAMKK